MMNLIDIGLEIQGRTLFKDVQLNLVTGKRYAVVGANGAGKSTFLKMLAQEETPSHGVVDKPKDARLGLLKQDHFRYNDHRVLDVVLDGKPELVNALREKDEVLLKEEIEEADGYRLGELEEIILHFEGYTAESEAGKILSGLGILQAAHDGPLSALSGGYKLRVLLAQALFKNPDILLLDEPTNHLDIVSIQWLENFLLKEYKGLLIFVTHDKSLINKLATHILDVDYGTILPYVGNYDQFLAKKAEMMLQKEQTLANKQQRIDDLQGFVDRFGAKASKARQAQSRVKMIERIEMDLPEIQNSSRMEPHFGFTQKRPSGKQVLEVKKLSKSFPEKKLYHNLNFHLSRGQKCAIIGPNGVGKSTLLKMLMGEFAADEGHIGWNENVSIGYFSQNFHDLLDPKESLLRWLTTHVSGVGEFEARKALGKMLFSGDAVNKKIGVLSGGECARLIFAKLLLEQHNVLILDEPTNHLDLEAIDGLMTGLKNFTGTLLCVSHNREFVQKVASTLLVMTPRHIDVYAGTYQEYLDKVGLDYFLASFSN